jgi:xanthine/uracil permease
MFEGEKTRIFWIGLVILALSSTFLFSVLWYTLVSTPFHYWNWNYLVPPVVGAVIFILIGLYMMKSGVRKEKRETPGSTKLL